MVECPERPAPTCVAGMSLRSESSDLRVGLLDLSIAAPAVVRPMRFGAVYARMLALEFIVVALAAYGSSVGLTTKRQK